MGDTRTDRADARDADEDLSHLPPRKRGLLRWLDEDAQRPDEMGEEWWDEFEEFLRTHRLKIGPSADES